MKQILTTILLAFAILPFSAHAQVSYTSDEELGDQIVVEDTAEQATSANEETETMPVPETGTAKKYYSTSATEVVLYRDGKQVGTMPLGSDTMHSAADSSDSSELPTASVPSTIFYNDTELVIGSGSTSSAEVEEIVVEAEKPVATNSGSGMGTMIIYSIGAIAVIGGAIIGRKILSGKKTA